MRNVKIISVSNKDAYEYSSPQPIDEFNAEVIANVCPFCGTPVKWADMLAELLTSLYMGERFPMTWVNHSVDEFCCSCGKSSVLGEILDCIEQAKMLKVEFEKALETKDRAIGLIVQSFPVNGLCRICSDLRGYFCAYCRKKHKETSSKFLDHRIYAIRRKSALREARRLCRKILDDKEMVILAEVDEDVLRPIHAILDRKGIPMGLTHLGCG